MRNPLLSLILLLSVALTSCNVERFYDNYSDDIQGSYSVSGYLYPFYGSGPSLYYNNVGLDIEWYSPSKVLVYLYTGWDFFEPFSPLECRVSYDYRNRVYYLYNNYYDKMELYVYDDGYVYLNFPYAFYSDAYGKPYGYKFEGYYYGPIRYKTAPRSSEAAPSSSRTDSTSSPDLPLPPSPDLPAEE